MSLVDCAIWSFAWGGGAFSMEHVLVTASVSTYKTFIVGLSLLQTSQSLQSKTFEINVHESDIDFEKRMLPVEEIIEILPLPQSL